MRYQLAEQIIRDMETLLDISKDELTGYGRKAHISSCRKVAFALIRDKTILTLSEIGELFNKNHKSVWEGIRTLNKLDPYYLDVYELLKDKDYGTSSENQSTML